METTTLMPSEIAVVNFYKRMGVPIKRRNMGCDFVINENDLLEVKMDTLSLAQVTEMVENGRKGNKNFLDIVQREYILSFQLTKIIKNFGYKKAEKVNKLLTKGHNYYLGSLPISIDPDLHEFLAYLQQNKLFGKNEGLKLLDFINDSIIQYISDKFPAQYDEFKKQNSPVEIETTYKHSGRHP